MPVYRPAPVSAVPVEYIYNWRIMELLDGDRHIRGCPVSTGSDGRVSSKIMMVDGSRLTTRSGRVYVLMGPSREDIEADYVWSIWCGRNGLDPNAAKDVSHEYKGVENVEDAKASPEDTH